MRIRPALAVIGALALTTTAGGLAAGLTAGPAAADTDPGVLIIGGDTVASAPWAAAVFNGGGFSCSGSIVAEAYVLTAHHCINGNRMSVRVGSVQRSSGGTVANVVSTASSFDLALLRLDRSIAAPYPPLAAVNPPLGSTNTIYGWGQTCFSGCGASGQLKSATVRFDRLSRDAEGGQALHSTRITGNAWYGDSGGPQFYDGQIVGVASTADGQAIQNYASVANSIAWIRSVIGTGGTPNPPPPNPPPPRTDACTATYTLASQWQGGYQADVRVTAGRSINGWTVTLTFSNAQTVQQAWNATVTATGSTLTARNVGFNGTLATGASTGFGYIGNSVSGAPTVSCTGS